MNWDILQHVITITISISSLIISIKAFLNTSKLNNTQLNEIRKANRPHLFIAHLNVYPKYIKRAKIKDEWMANGLSAKGKSAYIEYLNDRQKTRKLIRDEKRNQKVNNRTLVLNLLTNKDDIEINYCTTEIVLQNGGEDLQAYQLDNVVIGYTDKYNVELEGDKQAYQCYIKKGQTFNLWLTEITNNNKGTICDVDKIVGKKSKFSNMEDILYMDLGKNFLNYKSLTIGTTLTNIRGESCSYNIIIEVKDGKVTSKSELTKWGE